MRFMRLKTQTLKKNARCEMPVKEIGNKITPLIARIEKDYKPQDITRALLGIAFDMLLKSDPDLKRTFNVFRALGDNIGREKMKPQKI